MEPMSQTPLSPSLDKTSPNGTSTAVDGSPSPVEAAPESPVQAGPLAGSPDPLAAPVAPVAPGTRGFRLQRSRKNRMLGGVCGGLAESLNIDVALLRIGLVAVTLLGAGIGAVLYVAAWILAPEADAE